MQSAESEIEFFSAINTRSSGQSQQRTGANFASQQDGQTGSRRPSRAMTTTVAKPKWDSRSSRLARSTGGQLNLPADFWDQSPHDLSYYSKCMLGGALACGFTHAGITPLDVTKCNMQARPSLLSSSLFKSKLILRRSTLPSTKVSCPVLAPWCAKRGPVVSGKALDRPSSDTVSKECSSTVSTNTSRTRI